MDRIPPFNTAELEAACKILADTSNGLSGSEIGYLLQDIRAEDTDPSLTKWKRLFNALAHQQNKHQVGNHLVMFVTRALNPVRYANDAELFSWRRNNLNIVLALCGFHVREDGKVARVSRATSLSDAQARAAHLKQKLEHRGTHPEVFKYCSAELLQENYYHAVLEAVKGLAQRIRDLSGLTSDGADLVAAAFGVKAPIIAVNSLMTDTQISEQKGISNLLVGLFGAIRNPTAHAPKIAWSMTELDALDTFSLISFLNRKLDGATVNRGKV